MKYLLSFSLVSLFSLEANAWGASGHQAVGYIAMEFLAPNALSFVQSNLVDYNQSLGVAATWADEVRSNKSYAWSSALHYVDAEDNPPSSCSVEESRDCPDGFCVLTAIANYTARVVDSSLDDEQRQEALKFVTHFIGDIGQPLHVEAVEEGGNGLDVTCDGADTNLHSVWDSLLVNKLLNSTYENSVNTWVNALVTRIKSGEYASSASSWIACSDALGVYDELDLITASSDCPLGWAKESNALDCSYVFSYTDFDDLCTTSYFKEAVPHIEEQIAKQGYRLAAWLNVLFDGQTNL